jgi:hypothetical protein
MPQAHVQILTAAKKIELPFPGQMCFFKMHLFVVFINVCYFIHLHSNNDDFNILKFECLRRNVTCIWSS